MEKRMMAGGEGEGRERAMMMKKGRRCSGRRGSWGIARHQRTSCIAILPDRDESPHDGVELLWISTFILSEILGKVYVYLG